MRRIPSGLTSLLSRPGQRSEEFRRAHARADNKTGESLYLGHPKFEGFEVIQTERKSNAAA